MECLDSLLSVFKTHFGPLSYFWYIFICLVSTSSNTCPPSAVDEIVLTWKEAEMNPTTFAGRIVSHFVGENILI